MLAIRAEYKNNILLNKAEIATNATLYDCSINYFWTLTICDLQKKIIAYSIDCFTTSINWEGKQLKNIDDLSEVTDDQIITGAFKMGIIKEDAHFFLQQCRNLQNSFSVSHDALGEIDKLEFINFIKNCVKYVLSRDLPSPGLQTNPANSLYLERVEDAEEKRAICESRIHGEVLIY